MAECRIEVITYEQSRLEYFKELQNRQKKRFEQFEKSSAIKELPPQERHYQLSKMGEVLQYYDDIVKMLEDCTQSEDTGFAVFECRKCGCVLHVGTIEEMRCLSHYDCPNCGEEPEDNWLFVRLDKER